MNSVQIAHCHVMLLDNWSITFTWQCAICKLFIKQFDVRPLVKR